jgi:para-aminobenzoate synthetase component 1
MGTQAVELPVNPTELLARCASEPFPVVLDGQGSNSWGCGEALLAFAPYAVLRIDDLASATVRDNGASQTWHGDPLDLFERFCRQHVPATGAGDGRVVVAALSYDLRRCIEPSRRSIQRTTGLPLIVAAAYDWNLRYSYLRGRFHLHVAAGASTDLATRAADLQRRAAQPVIPRQPPAVCVRRVSSRADHAAAVQRILEYIAAGDVYQVNLAQRFSGRGRIDPVAVFATMQRLNAVPFGAYLAAGDFTLLSNSPECFLALHGDEVSTAPIKGTRPRGSDPATDAALGRELRGDAKERAEHVMIVDLERNDLGRVCQFGSVRVESLAELRLYPRVQHLVSTVRGRRRAGVGLADLLRATFPGGSITGAPKIRAMEIIDEIECHSRGFYTGALGCVHSLEEAVFSLTIRTATASADRIDFWAGGGIVADSQPEREYQESLLKAMPFLSAVSGVPS